MTQSPAAFAALMLLFGAVATGAAQAQSQESYTYSTYFYCDVTQQDRADEIVGQLDKPAFEAVIAGGGVSNWGWLKHHTGGKWRRVQFYSASSIDALLAAQKAVGDQTEATAKGKALGKEFGNACKSHDDYIWRSVAGNVGTKRGAAAFSVYYVCDSSREDQADALVKRVFAPLYDKMVADGKLTSWGWMEHIVGGEYRRLATMTAKDVTSLMAARAALIAAFQDDPLSGVLDDICGSHADYMWETQFSAP